MTKQLPHLTSYLGVLVGVLYHCSAVILFFDVVLVMWYL